MKNNESKMINILKVFDETCALEQYPKAYVERLEKEARDLSKSSKPFDNIEDMIASLEEK